MTRQAIPIAAGRDALPDRAELLRRARALAPTLRERAAQGEALRRAPDETIADLVRSGVLKSCQPSRFGGNGLGWDTACEIVLELAQGDGSQAWVAGIYAAMAYFTGLFDERTQREIWEADPDALIAGSIVPQGNRVDVAPDGYRLSGRWGFTSGVHHADWVVLAENAQGQAGKPRQLYFMVPASTCRILDDWHTVGMAATGSASVVVEDLFVPAHRLIANDDVASGTAPGARVNGEPIFRMPLMGYAQLLLASVPLGVAIGMLDDFRAILAKAAAAAIPPPGLELLHERFSRSSAELAAARLLLLDANRINMATLARGEALVEAHAAQSMRDSGYAVAMARQASARLFEATGGRGIYLSAPMQRGMRDVQASGAHASLSWERSALRYAKSALA